MIYIASDHGGFKLKALIKKHLEKEKLPFADLGPTKYVETDDYPDYAKLVGQKVSKNPSSDVGIIVCRSGQGVSIVANKFPHVRAVDVDNVAKAKLSREHVQSNVLCLSGDFLSPHSAQNIVDTWLSTPPGKGERHVKRVEKINKIEEQLYK
jgi:ribose 5-phosphate isomerase B